VRGYYKNRTWRTDTEFDYIVVLPLFLRLTRYEFLSQSDNRHILDPMQKTRFVRQPMAGIFNYQRCRKKTICRTRR